MDEVVKMVAIKDFGIPSCCVNCDMCTSDNPLPKDENRGYCHVTQKSITNIYDERPSDCPLVEIEERKADKLDQIRQIVNDWNNDASLSFGDMCKINKILKE